MSTVILGDYRLKTLLYESAGSRLYRGERQVDRCPVVIKLLKDLYLTPETIARFRREYELTRRLQMPGVIGTYGFEWLPMDDGGLSHPAMILEDFGGDSLLLLGMAAGIPLEPFFAVAIAVVEAIAGIHRASVIHKDLNPSNIIYNPHTGQVKLIDFGIATDLAQETLPFLNPTCLEGTLPYLAPEQTGRVNRSLDYRTDYYALGVTFYQLLTGQLPFEADDPLGWVHHHIAKQPQFDAAVRSHISDTLAAIVLKLMAKNADDRYQSAPGLLHDLQRCREAYQQTGQITSFRLGEADQDDRLMIPQTLYGRTAERAQLLSLFQATVAGERHYALISGVSGVGKTALVQELYQPITTQSGFFVSGKYDQQHRNQPYAGFAQAFDKLGRLILTASHTRFATWQQKVQAAVGQNGQVLLDVVPIWAQILGPQPPVPELGWQETQHRFHQVLGQFVAALCDPAHPLVVFIDDWQWADMASLALLKALLTQPKLHYFLFLGAYRSNEVDRGHPLLSTIATLTDPAQKFTPQYHALRLDNLTVADVTQLLADTLKLPLSDCEPLATLVYEKTAGNPFFTREFLTRLYHDQLLQRRGKHWFWEIDTIRTRNLTDNVVALMADRLGELPPASLETVKLAACLGDRFEIATLSQIRQGSATTTLANLMPPLQTGILLPLDHHYRLLEGGDEGQGAQACFRFAHDRLQQAAYCLLDAAQKPAIHLHIGQTLLVQTNPQTLGDEVFAIANHLNLGASLLVNDTDRQQLARLNLLAGQKAQHKSADALAYAYFEQGIALVRSQLSTLAATETRVNGLYELYRDLLVAAAAAAAMLGNYAAMTTWATAAIAHVQSPEERAAIRLIEIQAAISQDQRSQAIHIALTTLPELGVTLSAQPPEPEIAESLQQTATLFAALSPDHVVALPESQDPTTLAATRILVEIISVCFNSNPQLLLLVITRLIQMSLQEGHTPLTPFAYTAYGMLLCGALQNFELGERAGQVALGLLDRFGDRSAAIRARTLHMIHTFIDSWVHPLATVCPQLLTDYGLALDTGDREFAVHSLHLYCLFRFLCGVDLATVEAEMATYADVIEQLNKPASLSWQRIWWQAVANLRGQVANPCRLCGEVYNEQESIPVQRAKGDVTGLLLVYWHKAVLAYRWRNYPQAYECICTSEPYLSGVVGLPLIPLWHLDLALICSALLVPPSARPTDPVPETGVDPNDLEQRIADVEAALTSWGTRSRSVSTGESPSYAHRLALLAAERHRRQGNWVEALGFYDQAIDGAIAQGFLNEATIAAELALQMMQAWGKSRLMRTYFQETRLLYSRWGAIGKLQDLERRYPELWHSPIVGGAAHPPTSLPPPVSPVAASPLYTSPVPHNDTLARLDLHSVLKASQSLARDLDLETLLGHMMAILLENAGAERGYLLVPDADDWSVLAQGQVGEATIVCSPSQPRRSLTDLPDTGTIRKVLDYVGHTQTAWVPTPEALADDDTSRLGLPLYNQGQLVAMLYLENRLVPHAFTAERLEVLQLLSGQMASSLQNAQLYSQLQNYSQDLEHKVAERTQELIHLNQELQRLATTDGLTKIYNRRYFDQQLRLEWHRLQREQLPLSLLLFDVDHFKAYNDYYGHQAGDECLIQIAQATQIAVHRPADLVARYGGEEFTVILPNTDQAGAFAIATRVCQAIAAKAIPHVRSLVKPIVSISLGVATLIPMPEGVPEKLISLADEALYRAKREGRDRIAIA